MTCATSASTGEPIFEHAPISGAANANSLGAVLGAWDLGLSPLMTCATCASSEEPAS